MERIERENKQHSSLSVPYTYYQCMVPGGLPNVAMHWHGELELNYVKSGSSEFVCGDSHFVVHPGAIVLIPSNMIHAIYPHGEVPQKHDTLVFSPELLGVSAADRGAQYLRSLLQGSFPLVHLQAGEPLHAEVAACARQIFAAAGISARMDLLVKSELLRIMWLLEGGGYLQPTAEPPDSRSEMLRPALAYINRNFHRPITIEELADTVHLSKSYFMACFRQAAGISALEYVNQLRIKTACELLRDGKKTALEVAFQCGFRNVSNFNKQFKRLVGCTPSEYRKSSRSG